MLIKKVLISLMGITLSSVVLISQANEMRESPYYLGAYGGYGTVKEAYHHDGQMAQGRLVFGLDSYPTDSLHWGAELGFQSGNTMRLRLDPQLLETTGGLIWQATLKPSIDLLLATKMKVSTTPLYLVLKAGIAYRQLQLNDRDSSRDSLRKINPEVQAGLGFNITDNTKLLFLYQGIYSKSSRVVGIDAAGDSTLSHIPRQHAGLMGIEYSL